MTDNVFNHLVPVLKMSEGWEHCCYPDSRGIITIGCGHNLEANPWIIRENGVRESVPASLIRTAKALSLTLTKFTGLTMTDGDISATLREDIAIAERMLLASLPWVNGLDEPRYMVLIDMTFNMGISTLLGFKNTLRAVQEGRFKDAAAGMLASRWASQVGAWAAGTPQAKKYGRPGRAWSLAKQMESGMWQ